MVNKINKEAWSVLTEPEQLALSLGVLHNKSSWQAGEIMNKSHYKYLEIDGRAKTFIKLFTEHFNKYYNNLIPPTIGGLHKDFGLYFEETILKRKTKTEIIDLYPNSMLYITLSRDRTIREGFITLSEGKTEAHSDLLFLLKEFDRWNNFRVLPEDLQEPSAYKRRIKARSRKILTKLYNLPEDTIDIILGAFQYNKKKSNIVYMTLLSKHINNDFTIIKVLNDEVNINILSTIGYHIFENREDAEYFGEITSEYVCVGDKSCKSGQDFWKNFRDTAELAINWRQVNHLIPNRKYLKNLEETINLSNITINAQRTKSRKKLKKKHNIQHKKGDKFWGKS